MKIWEIDFSKENVEYKDNTDRRWRVRYGGLYDVEEDIGATDVYSLSSLLDMCFKRVADWSKATNNDRILVKDKKGDNWRNRHFARYENGKVFAWEDGRTSWTTTSAMCWEYAKLAEVE